MIFADATTPTTPEVIAIAATLLSIMGGAVAFAVKVTLGLMDRMVRGQEARDAAHVAERQAMREEQTAERNKHRAEITAERERTERANKGWAEDAASMRAGIGSVFQETARAIELARGAVEIMAQSTPQNQTTPIPRDRVSAPELPSGPGTKRAGRPSRG